MKKPTDQLDEMRPEYDFSKLKLVARGPGRRHRSNATVILAEDVAEVFPTSESVNEALRFLIRATRQNEPAST